ncbi:hypothetical protein TSAR_008306 [Trichomalopsis sarcophagae]|uniref:dolichyl-phosphate-mannose--protein mannosyltransferase n=1 Tax=Trichomalopsis sarcophagae TaxID=543379 RepID=A0A232FD09_9HYME|nr:hypothetical protein TSAR_008306 [Trichomalopsis sarcophagae]
MYRISSRSQPRLALPARNLTISVTLIIVASLCCSSSRYGDFVFDDSEAIVNNEDVREAPLYQLFQNDFWGTKLSHKHSHKSYRPLTILSFRMHYWFKGYLDPTDFHAVNIILHIIVCIMTLFIFEILLDWKEPQISFWAALLFAVHPVHTEAVAGLVGRADVLCGLFMWLSILSYYKCIHSDSFIIQYNCIVLCIMNSAIAMFCKETGITILGVCIIYDLIIVNKVLPTDLLEVLKLRYSWNDVKRFYEIKSAFVIRITVLVLAGVLLILLRFIIMEFSKPTFKPVDNPASFIDNLYLRIVNYNYIYCLNVWLLICPVWLCFDWSMGCVPLINGIDLRIGFVILLWLSFGVFSIGIFSNRNSQLIRYILMSMAVLIIPFLPASNLFFKVGFVLAERTLYIPSAGYCLLLAIGLKQLSANVMYPKIVSASYCALLIVFFARSWMRSSQWKTETELFQSGLNVCPLNAKVHYNVGKNAADRGLTDYAKLKYEEAIKLNPDYAQAMNNLGNLYKDEDAYDKAEELLSKAVELQNNFAAAWMNLGIVLSATNKYEEAEKSYITAISQRNTYPDCYYNLGLLYLSKKEYDKAFKAWEITIKQKPLHRRAWINTILLYDNMGKREKSLEVAKQALLLIPRDPSIHFNVGNILGKKGSFEEAEHHFKIAISEEPNNPSYYTNLGVLYHRWKKYNKAEIMYKKALILNPHSQTAKENLNKLNNIKLKTII